MRRHAILAIPALLFLAACSGGEPTEPPEPTVTVGTVTIPVSQRQAYCESFARITPGWFETSADMETLADPGSTHQEKLQAMRRQAIPDMKRNHPYDCDLKSDAALFADFVQDAEANKASEGK